MDAWTIKPRDFDPSKKYPVFVFVYGQFDRRALPRARN
jgi:dipeptidyl-peptidase 4